MSPTDTDDDIEGENVEVITDEGGDSASGGDSDAEAEEGAVKARLEESADKAVDQFDERLVDLLAWLLDTETRARIYVHLRQHPNSTSDEIAEGTGLYPSTVRECLAAMHEEGLVTREKRASEGAGNNPYEYNALAPGDLVTDLVSQIQDQLNTVCNLDRHLDDRTLDGMAEPVRIEVDQVGDD
jgi:predicted transcriptional regulator